MAPSSKKRRRDVDPRTIDDVVTKSVILDLDFDDVSAWQKTWCDGGLAARDGAVNGIDAASSALPVKTETKASTVLLHHILPYMYTFTTHCKARWVGRTVVDVYTSEFGSYPREYYQAAVKQGRIKVRNRNKDTSGTVVDVDYKLQHQDTLMHTVHRHEPAVAVHSRTAPYVNVVFANQDIVVVDKPSTLPVHACGGYHQNSLIKLLEPVFGKLYNSNRLDRLTSGLVILGKSSSAAQKWAKAIKERTTCQKLYFARVKGRFGTNLPDHILQCRVKDITKAPMYGEAEVDGKCDAINLRETHGHAYWIVQYGDKAVNDTIVPSSLPTVDGWSNILSDEAVCNDESCIGTSFTWLHLACPVRVEQHKDGICKCGTFDDLSDGVYNSTVKAAHTAFALLSYDEKTDTSLVLCRPFTGRTHQIRLHLQYLQHAIADDPNYGGETWHSNDSGRHLCEVAHRMLDSSFLSHTTKHTITSVDDGVETGNKNNTPASSIEVGVVVDSEQKHDEDFDQFLQRTCVWCQRSQNQPVLRNTLEFATRSYGIYLHAYQYRIVVNEDDASAGTSYRTDYPAWAEL